MGDVVPFGALAELSQQAAESQRTAEGLNAERSGSISDTSDLTRPDARQLEGSEGHVDRDLLDAKLEASEARTDAKFADVRGELAGIRAEFAALRGDLTGIAAGLREEIVNGRAQSSTDAANLRTEVATLLGDSARSMGELRGEVQAARAVIDSKPSKFDLWGAALTIAGLVIATMLAVWSLTGDSFSAGVSLADKRQEQLQRDNAQDEALKNIGTSLQAIDRKVTPK